MTSLRWELRMTRELAIALGAIEPSSVEAYKALFNSGRYILIRERTSGLPLFWELQPPLTL